MFNESGKLERSKSMSYNEMIMEDMLKINDTESSTSCQKII